MLKLNLFAVSSWGENVRTRGWARTEMVEVFINNLRHPIHAYRLNKAVLVKFDFKLITLDFRCLEFLGKNRTGVTGGFVLNQMECGYT
jgi:hypothetical protein